MAGLRKGPPWRAFLLFRPVRSVWTFLWSLWSRTDRAELNLIAAGVAFYGFLAIFPALAAVITIWGIAADPVAVKAQLAPLQDFLPAQAFQVLSDQVDSLILAGDRTLGWPLLVSTGLAIWSARAGVAALIRGLNAIHGLPNRAGHWHQLQALIMTLVLIALVIAAMTAAIVGPILVALLPVGWWQGTLLDAANIFVAAMLVTITIGIIYRFGPNTARRPRLFTRGLFVALVLWGLASRGFVLYITNFAAYNQVYGSIGAVAALLGWFYLSAYAVLLGAAVDAERRQ
jgi:membrane protein